MLLIWKLAWDMPMNDRKGNEYHAINNTIDKQLSSLKVNIYIFFLLWINDKQISQGSCTIRSLRYPWLILER